MRNISTMKKILILVGILVLMLGVVAVMGGRTASSILTGQQEMFEDFARPATWITDCKALAIQTRRFTTELLAQGASVAVTQERNQGLIARMEENTQGINTYLENYEKTIDSKDAEEKRLYGEMVEIRAQVNKLRAEVVAVVQGAGFSDWLTLQKTRTRLADGGDIAVAEEAYIDAITKLAHYVESNAVQINTEMVGNAQRAQWMLTVTSVVAAILGVILAILVSRTITKPLLKMENSIQAFAQGDLSTSFDLNGTDEVAVISQNLQKMLDILSEVIGSVNEAGRDISETAEDFSAMVQETNASIEEFRANVDEMAGNLDSLSSVSEEVNASVQEVAAGAQTTAEKGTDIARKVDDAMTAGDKGINAVRSVVEGISRVAESATAATGAIMQLGDRARQIQSFVSQIGGIADQTNLLALNAAIEAARAGEAGRGFAVVAEEGRKLAQNSNVAAKNIADLAGTITSEIDTIVGFSQENASDSGSAKDLSTETETEINNMIHYLREIASATQDLAAIAQEQAASSEEISESVQSMSTKIGSTATAGENIHVNVGGVAAASERIAQGVVGLTALSTELHERLSFFKLEEDTGTTQKKQIRALPG